jgi:ATP-dependent DNA helicase RecG
VGIPTDSDIERLLDELDEGKVVDDLESQWLDFKPWREARSDMRVACDYAVCFSNADGGAVVFGVNDKVAGRANAIHGCGKVNIDTWRKAVYDATRPHVDADVHLVDVREGTGHLLVVRVREGSHQPYGTSDGTYRVRVGKNCEPLDPGEFARQQARLGTTDWSAQIVEGLIPADLDVVEIARARNRIRDKDPGSVLLTLSDKDLLVGLGVTRGGGVTNAGLVLFGHEDQLRDLCPQSQVHYVYQTSDTSVARNDQMRLALLNVLEHIETSFSGAANPEQELSVGFFKVRIPAFPLDVVREAVLNAVTHRDYTVPEEVFIKHQPHELAISSPGTFIGGITPHNILRHDPVARNKTLADALLKMRLVESAGTGARRMFSMVLQYGKRAPAYEADEWRVRLHIYDGNFDERTARLVVTWREKGREPQLDELLILSYLREHPSIDTRSAASLLQVDIEEARSMLEVMATATPVLLERQGRTRAATFALSKAVARELTGRVTYSKAKGIEPERYEATVRQFVAHHGSITPAECRELLGLGDSQTARVQVSKYLARWSSPEGFLKRTGVRPRTVYLRADVNAGDRDGV